jgi:hypothetical protein
MLALQGQAGRLQRRASSHVRSLCSRPVARSLDSTAECRTPFREPLQFIVMSVMSVMRGTFPYTYGVVCMTVNRWCVRGPSCHRHGERHRRNALPKQLPRSGDGDDAHDGPLRAYSRQRVSLYLLGAYPFHPDPTNPTHRARSPIPMRSLRSLAASGYRRD